MKNYILYSLSIVLLISCSRYDDDFSYPISDGSGDYRYESISTYFKPEKNEEKRVKSEGYLRSTSFISSYEFNVMPNMGWSYTIYAQDTQTEILTNGDTVITFRINLASQTVNSEEFRIAGTTNVELYDSDGSLIRYVDGYIRGSTIVYEFESRKANSTEYTITRTEARRR